MTQSRLTRWILIATLILFAMNLAVLWERGSNAAHAQGSAQSVQYFITWSDDTGKLERDLNASAAKGWRVKAATQSAGTGSIYVILEK